jgi:carboxyl-terminal processing protease
VLDDPSPKTVWDGPLAVLVNRFSASASEIFAAAIQDYGRGVVIGQQTYGKGTVQNLYPLDRYAHGSDPRFGQLTLTIGKYYRVTGGSTQHRGVEPDIALPSAVDVEVVGESARPTALPWDQIRATDYNPRGYLGGAIDLLSTNHDQRAVLDPDLNYLRENVEEQERQRDHKSVSLNLEARERERVENDARRLAAENARREAQGLAALETLEELADEDVPDVQLKEAAEVVVDLMSPEAEALARNAPRPGS